MTSERDSKRQRRSDEDLLRAASSGDVAACRMAWAELPHKEEIRAFHRERSPWDSINHEYTSPLHMAARHGHMSVVRLLVQEFGFPVDQIDHHAETPLGAACHQGRVEMSGLLLEELGADPDLGGGIVRGYGLDRAMCPLRTAARNGSTDIVELLIQHGARTDFSSVDHVCSAKKLIYPTEVAIRNSNVGVLNVFIEHEADFPLHPNANTTDFQGCSDVIMGFLVTLINEGKRNKITLYLSRTLRMLLAHGRTTQLSRFFDAGLQYGALSNPLDEQDSHCASPIHFASENGYHRLCEMFLLAGANVDEKNETGRTPLLVAAEEDQLEVCKVLIQNGATVDETDDEGWTALQLCLKRGGRCFIKKKTMGICEALLSAGADVLLQEGASRSALELSASLHDESLMERFLIIWDSRFEVNHGRNDAGDLPLHVAVTNPNISLPVIGALLRHNSKALSVPDRGTGWLPLHLACLRGAHLDAVFSILRAYPSAVDPNTQALELVKRASD